MTSQILITMSSVLVQLVSVLDGSNYLQWADQIEAYFMANDLWSVVIGNYPQPTELAIGTDEEIAANHKEREDWMSKNHRALGNLRLRIAPTLHHTIKGKSAAEAWQTLKDTYGKPGPSVIFADFKALISFRINDQSHPLPQIQKMAELVNRLTVNNMVLPDLLQAMILMNAATSLGEHRYNHLTSEYS